MRARACAIAQFDLGLPGRGSAGAHNAAGSACAPCSVIVSIRGECVVPCVTQAQPGSMERIASWQEGEQKLVVGGRELRTIRIGLQGWVESSTGLVSVRASYQAVAWLSPDLGRVVRYEARSRSPGNSGGASFSIDEAAELVRVGRD